MEKLPSKINPSAELKGERAPYATIENKEETKRIVQEIHEIHPDIVFFTMTSALNIAILLKEAWKSAYPNEDIPSFYGVNPHANYEEGSVLKSFNRKMESLGEGQDLKNKRIIVFDEYRGSPGDSFRKPVKYSEIEDTSGVGGGSRLREAAWMIRNFVGSGENIYLLGGHASKFGGSIFGANPENTGDNLEVKDIYKRLYENNFDEDIVRVIHGKEGKELMNKLKEIGTEAGKELLEQLNTSNERDS